MDIKKSIQLAFEHYRAGNFQQAANICIEILEIQPDHVDALHFLGIICYQLRNYNLAITCFEQALQFNPTYIDAYYNLGRAYQRKGQFNEAIDSFQKAIQLNTNFADAYNNIGNILQEKGQFDDAIIYYQKTIQINPDFAAAYNNLGSALNEKGQPDNAIVYYQKALQLNPNLADAYSNLGGAFQEKGQLDVAIDCCKKALEINPDHAEAFSLLTAEMQQTCNWREFEAMTVKLNGLTRKALDTGTKPAETPFMSIIRHADPSLNFAIAKSWSRDIERTMSNLKIHFSFDDRKTYKTKIVIGYLSDDFRNHAMGHLTCSMFGLHNRDNFKIYCYSYGNDDGSYYRTRIQQDCDKFVDISSLSYDAAARCIYEDQVDILVDLKGYTRGSRLAIYALRPAPIQVGYLGFAGTTGADFIDYIITDKIVTPKYHSPYYSEKFVYMPHCYLVNNHTQPISNKDWKKADFGLPENCFLFCSFNIPYKIEPVMFDIWMRILKQIPESVLWLIFESKIAEDNLRREAEARGVKPQRLIFAKLLPKDEHLARLRFADLALDTRIVNGHTTTSDALWSGVPVITLQGSHLASRVSSSILYAMDLPDLITYSLEEYETLAVRLARNPVELQEIRQKIAKKHIVTPLFDTPRFVRNLETAYKEMWKIFLAGESPQQIEVLES